MKGKLHTTGDIKEQVGDRNLAQGSNPVPLSSEQTVIRASAKTEYLCCYEYKNMGDRL